MKTRILINVMIFTMVLINLGYAASSDTMIIKTKKGDVKANNITINPDREGKDYVDFQVTEDYAMSFHIKDQFFNIGIFNIDIQSSRDKAEKAFLKALGIDKKKACLLNLNLGVPFSSNNAASGLNHGLSFCPGGIPFSSDALAEAKTKIAEKQLRLNPENK